MESPELFDELKCPVCMEIPINEIFLCENGHIMCDMCLENCTQCPQCRASFDNIKVRNRPLEVLLDATKLDCLYRDQGCPQKVGRKQLQAHGINCTYNGKRFEFCKTLGFQCNFATNMNNIPLAIAHFREGHQFIVESRKVFPIIMEGFGRIANLKVKKRFLDSAYTPVIMDTYKCPTDPKMDDKIRDYKFRTFSRLVILTLMNGTDMSTSWICVCLSSDSAEAGKFQIEFKIQSHSTEVPDLVWTTNAIDVNSLNAVLPNLPFRMPNNLLTTHYLSKGGSLWVDVKLNEVNTSIQENITDSAPLEPTWIFNSLLSSAENNESKQNVVFDNARCEDCGMCPLKGIRYQHLQEDYNVCENCILKGNHRRRWFGVIKSAENGHVVNHLWNEKQVQWSKSLFGTPLQNSHSRCLSSKGCLRPATYTCLQCNNLRHYSLCHQCYIDHNSSHIFAMFLRL